jgi:hypothetical protein
MATGSGGPLSRAGAASELEQLIATEERLAAMLRDAEAQAKALIEEARGEVAGIAARAALEQGAKEAALTERLRQERDSTLARLREDFTGQRQSLDQAERVALTRRVLAELLRPGGGAA